MILTEIEVRIVGLVGLGSTNATAAYSLGISEPAIKSHLNRIYRKLKLTDDTGNNRVNLSLWARAHSDAVYSTVAA